jgi:ABC-type multidrug transport system ATPase subunit
MHSAYMWHQGICCRSLAAIDKTRQRDLLIMPSDPSQVFETFDDVLLLDGGQVVYHGPREAVLQHFQSLGYRCPPRKDVADFLVEVRERILARYLCATPSRVVPSCCCLFAIRST